MCPSENQSPEVDLFAVVGPKWESANLLCSYGYPRVEARLIIKWNDRTGRWSAGWFCKVDSCVDEWMPETEPRPGWPWYRPTEQPNSAQLELAAGSAARAAKIVLEQFLGYVAPDCHAALRAISDRMETQAQAWLCGKERL